MLRVVDIQGVVIERRQRADHAADNRHRMRVAPKAFKETGDLIVHHGVLGDPVLESLLLFRASAIRHTATADNRFRRNRIFGELFDGVVAVQQQRLYRRRC